MNRRSKPRQSKPRQGKPSIRRHRVRSLKHAGRSPLEIAGRTGATVAAVNNILRQCRGRR